MPFSCSGGLTPAFSLRLILWSSEFAVQPIHVSCLLGLFQVLPAHGAGRGIPKDPSGKQPQAYFNSNSCAGCIITVAAANWRTIFTHSVWKELFITGSAAHLRSRTSLPVAPHSNWQDGTLAYLWRLLCGCDFHMGHELLELWPHKFVCLIFGLWKCLKISHLSLPTWAVKCRRVVLLVSFLLSM